MTKDTFINLYSNFRHELDQMAVPLIYNELRIVEPILYDNKTVGFICGFENYIDGVYVMPEYRRKGLAKKAVLDYVNDKLLYGVKLHIINTNNPARKFWHSLFVLKRIETNEVDTLYEIIERR